MNRRTFLKAMIAACAAPAIVSAGSIMRINPDFYKPVTGGFLVPPEIAEMIEDRLGRIRINDEIIEVSRSELGKLLVVRGVSFG